MSKETVTHHELVLPQTMSPFIENAELEKRYVYRSAMRKQMLMLLQNPSEGRPSPDSAFVYHGEFLSDKMTVVVLTESIIVYSQL